ncbi:MAG: MltA domain-containing protein [Bauldia sp.]
MRGEEEAIATLRRVTFAALAGWPQDDHRAALQAFRRSAAVVAAAPPKTRRLNIAGAAVVRAAQAALALPGPLERSAAQAFFEDNFAPYDVHPPKGRGFFTGYYEPVVAGSLARAPGFTVPLYRRPPDLADVDDANRPAGWDPEIRFARRTAAGLSEFPDRRAIEAGALAGQGLELVWLNDPVDVFFIHIQGSARVRLADGRTIRLTFDGKSGHPYTAIGKVLIDRGEIARADVTMASIRAWLSAHPNDAPGVMAENRSFIFFKEIAVADPALGPVAAAGVALTPGRSLAVDRTLHTFGSPVWVETEAPDGPFRRLMFADDTGSAILGPARGDIFFGTGDAAAALAGAMKSPGRFVLLVPRQLNLPGEVVL